MYRGRRSTDFLVPGPRISVAALVGYFLGTFPSADIASRLATSGAVDLRVEGTGNPGAMNAMGELGTGWGVAVLISDVAKGSLAAWAGSRIGGDGGGYAAGTAAIGGHVFPVWKRFRGGKGVATSAGASLVLFPAFFPLDAGVAALSVVRSADADRAIEISSTVWAGAALLWWRARWPNAWGPQPTGGLPLFALVSSVVMITRVRMAKRARR